MYPLSVLIGEANFLSKLLALVAIGLCAVLVLWVYKRQMGSNLTREIKDYSGRAETMSSGLSLVSKVSKERILEGLAMHEHYRQLFLQKSVEQYSIRHGCSEREARRQLLARQTGITADSLCSGCWVHCCQSVLQGLVAGALRIARTAFSPASRHQIEHRILQYPQQECQSEKGRTYTVLREKPPLR